MKTFVVAYINWFDYTLHLERIEANDWREAWAKHTKGPWVTHAADMNPVPLNYEAAKQYCFDCDFAMNHIEV